MLYVPGPLQESFSVRQSPDWKIRLVRRDTGKTGEGGHKVLAITRVSWTARTRDAEIEPGMFGEWAMRWVNPTARAEGLLRDRAVLPQRGGQADQARHRQLDRRSRHLRHPASCLDVVAWLTARVLTGAVVLGAISAPGAAAHVTVQPAASRPADLQRYRVIVPNEKSTATVGVDLKLPAGVTFALAEQVSGWRVKVVKSGSAISELRWRGGPVPPGGYAELRFIARNPVKVGRVQWKALQRYADGSVVRWIGAAGERLPGAGDDAERERGAGRRREHARRGGARGRGDGGRGATPATASADDGDTERDGLTLAVAILGALLGAAALALQLTRGVEHRTVGANGTFPAHADLVPFVSRSSASAAPAARRTRRSARRRPSAPCAARRSAGFRASPRRRPRGEPSTRFQVPTVVPSMTIARVGNSALARPSAWT